MNYLGERVEGRNGEPRANSMGTLESNALVRIPVMSGDGLGPQERRYTVARNLWEGIKDNDFLQMTLPYWPALSIHMGG